MKTVVFCDDFPPRVGGIETYSLNLSTMLSQKGMEITVITSSQAGSDTIDQKLPFPVIRLRMDRKGLFWRVLYFLKVTLIIRKIRPDLAICIHAFRYCLIMNWAKAVFGLPYILFAHGKEVYPRKRGRRRRKVVRLCKGAARVIAVSSFTQKLLSYLDVPHDKSVVIPCGFDLPQVDQQTIDSLKTRYQLQGKRVLLTVSRLVKRKGHRFVLEALSEIKEKYPDLVYMIIGEGKERQVLEEKVKQLGLDGQVKFTGRVSNDDIPAFYALCDIFIMLSYEETESHDIEGFGIVYLEAGAFRKPVIGHNCGGVGDAVVHNETGLLVDNLSSGTISQNIVKLLEDPRLCRELGENGYRRVFSEFSWDSITSRIQSVCQDVTAGRSGLSLNFSQGPVRDLNHKPRILNLITSLSEGGVERQLCQLLPKLIHAGIETAVVCTDFPGKLAAVLQMRGVEVSLQRVRSRFHPLDIYRLARFIKRERVDLVHTHMYAASIPGVLAARLARVPAVVHVHNLHEWQRPRRIQTARRIWSRAARVVAISENVRQSLIGRCGLTPSKVQTLFNGVDLEHFAGHLKAEEERQRWGIGLEELVVGNVARLVPVKGHFDLLRAMADVQNVLPEVCLVLVGGGDLRSELEQEAKKLDLRVVFTGTQEDVRPLIGMFDLAVLSSLSEGMPIFLLEAMALAKPVVATNVGGIPEVVERGKTGHLAPPADPKKLGRAILDMLNGDYHMMGLAGRRRVEEVFSLDKTMTNIRGLYREILES